MWLEVVIFVAVVSLVYFYRWGTKNHDFFKKRNIPFEKPIFIFGGGAEIIFRKKTIIDVHCEMHKKHEGLLAFGAFDNRVPVLMLRDPQLIKHIMIKDFDHFVNRRNFFDNIDNLFNNSLFLMENEKWRDMRRTLSPAFTGSKMRNMFQFFLQTLDDAMDYLREQQQKNADNVVDGFELDMKEFTVRLNIDTIASTAFGLQVNSFRERDNEFYVKAKKSVTFTELQFIKVLLLLFLPKIAKLLNIKDMFDQQFIDYFKHLVFDTMKRRKENNIHRPDMIELLMEAKGMIPTDTPKTHHREWSDMEVVAQCFGFFFAAMEPLSAAMSFAAHELMEYPEVQQKLYEEIQQFDQQCQGKGVTYELLQKMPYMEMVVCEVLRKWPVTLITDRTCTKNYVYESPETGERIEIQKGDIIRVAMCAIHRDEQLYEDPVVFNPERFSEENKGRIESGAYLPFGLGPRNCIGNHFAMLEMKAFLYYLIRDYKLEASPKTTLPMVLCKKNAQVMPANGFWLQLKPRINSI